MARTTGGRISCDRNQKEMSLLRQGPNLYSKRLRPYAASDPITTARSDPPTDIRMLFSNRLMNSSRTVEVWKIVSGDRPSERQPFQSGWKSSQGTRWPCVTSTATLNDVVTVQ